MLTLFFAMLAKLFPLYFTMAAGFGLGRKTGDITQNLAFIQIYFIAPVVILTNVARLDLQPELILLPFLYFALSVFMAYTARQLAQAFKCDGIPIITQAGGAANNGYLGLPIAAMLFPPEWLPVYVLTTLGGNLYENTVGYYAAARGHFSAKEAIQKLLQLPSLYAAAAGLTLAALHIELPATIVEFGHNCLGAFIILGAMIIGFGVAKVRNWKFDWNFLGVLMIVKFLLWPLITVILIALDQVTIQFLTPSYRACFLLLSILPLAANSAAFAALFNIAPDRTATAVALSTVIAMILVPVFVILTGLAPINVLNP